METPIETPRRPWWQTALAIAAGAAFILGAVVFLVTRFSEPGSSDEPPPVAANEAPVVDQKAFDKEARAVAGRFILTAVGRNNTGASWELIDPTYPGKSGYTKQTWAKGDIPVIPFPGAGQAEARFNVTYSSPTQLTLEVALVPRRGEPAIFDLGLRRRGTGNNQRWLVDYWMTSYEGGRPRPPE